MNFFRGNGAIIAWLLIASTLFVALFATGCSGTGFNKKTTLMPDRFGISIGQQRYKTEDAAWRGINISAQWDLK